MYVNEKVYDDANIEEIEALPLSQPHRLVDSTVVAADEEGTELRCQSVRLVLRNFLRLYTIGYARTYIIFPSTVYGIAKNRLTESGLQNPYSIQIPYLIRAALDRGQGGGVGLGKNIWPNVHIDDRETSTSYLKYSTNAF